MSEIDNAKPHAAQNEPDLVLANDSYPISGLEEVCTVERKDFPDLIHSLNAEHPVFVNRLRPRRQRERSFNLRRRLGRADWDSCFGVLYPRPPRRQSGSHGGAEV